MKDIGPPGLLAVTVCEAGFVPFASALKLRVFVLRFTGPLTVSETDTDCGELLTLVAVTMIVAG